MDARQKGITIGEATREEIIKTGLTQEYREKRVGGRDPMHEFFEDYNVLGFCLETLLGELDKVQEELQRQKKSEDISAQVAHAREGLELLLQRWVSLGEQGELFAGFRDTHGNEISIKQSDLTVLKRDFRDWYTVVGGLKNVSKKTTHDFPRVQQLAEAIVSPEAEQAQYYSRGFSESVYQWEQVFAKQTGVPDVAVCNSGMAAIESCIRTLELRPGETLVVGEDFYYHTSLLLRELETKGITVITVDVSNATAVQQALEKYTPRAIFFEGIANAPQMRVADITRLLYDTSNWNEQHKTTPTRLIIDNTFASTGLKNITQLVEERGLRHAQWAGVESATKYHEWAMDNVTAGVVYSNDSEFIRMVKEKRAMIGTHLQERLVSYLPEADADILEQKMVRHSLNALLLSGHFEKMGLSVRYPWLETHPDSAVVDNQYVKGVGGVFYILWNNADGNPQEFVNRVAEEAERLGVVVKIGVSFGHSETWLETIPPDLKENWYAGDTRQWAIRVMPGEENVAVMQKVMQAFEKAYELHTHT